MLREAIERLVELGRNSGECEKFQTGRNTYKVVFADNQKDPLDITRPPPDRNHFVTSLTSLLEASAEFCEAEEEVTLWFSSERVIAVLEPQYRRDVVVLPLQKSVQFKELFAQEAMSIRRAVKWLIYTMGCDDMHGCVQALQETIFTKGTQSSQTTRHGAASLGKAVESAVKGAKEIPKLTTFSIPVFDTIGLNQCHEIVVKVDVDTDNEAVTFIPPPGSATALVHKALLEVLSAVPFQSFFGQP